MKQHISLRQANQGFSRYIAEVERGREFVVTRRGRPVALLSPAPKRAAQRLSRSGRRRWSVCSRARGRSESANGDGLNYTTMPRVSLDASIMVYSVDAADPAKHRAAKRLLRLAARHDCVLVLQALAEFYYVVTRKAKLGLPQARSQLRDLRSVYPLVLPGPAALDAAVDISGRYHINFWDAMLIAVAKQADVAVLFTEDLQDGQDYAGVRCVNPLERSAVALEALLRE